MQCFLVSTQLSCCRLLLLPSLSSPFVPPLSLSSLFLPLPSLSSPFGPLSPSSSPSLSLLSSPLEVVMY